MTKEELRGLNETLNSWERFFKREVLQSLPVAVGLPTGDNCNLRCIFCTERDEKSVYRYHNVSFSQFLAFAEPLRFASYIQIQGWGEPLYNPDYERIFDYVAQGRQGALISFNTNGVMLDNLWIEKLTSASNMHINVSLNAASRETYRSLMGRDHFHRVIDNIASLTRKRAKGRSKDPYVSVSMVGMEQNIRELPGLVDLAADLGADMVVLRDLLVLREELKRDSLFNHRELTAGMLKLAFEKAEKRGIPLDTSYFPVSYFLNELIPIGKSASHDSTEPVPLSTSCQTGNVCLRECQDPWRSLLVDAAGNVKICCYSDSIMGNMLKQSLPEIWNGAMYRFYRRHVNTSTPPADCRMCIKKRG